MDSPTPAAPAQPETPVTVPATVDAANRADFAAFDRAELGKRTGAPVEDVVVDPQAEPPATSASAPAPPERQLSKRQQELNDKIRDAVERATASEKARIADLEAQLRTTAAPKPAAPPDPAATAAAKAAEIKRIMALPGAPRLSDFESVEEHAFAAAAFIDEVRTQERATTAQQREHEEQRGKFLKDRSTTFEGHLKKAAETDPDFVSKIPPAVVSATPLSGCQFDPDVRALLDPRSGQPVTFANVAAEAAFRSENPAALLLHLNAHSDDVQRILARPQDEWLDALARLDGRLNAGAATTTATTASAPVAEAPRSPITAAPPPPPTLRTAGSTSDPKAAALAREDFAEYDRLETQERMAKLAPAR